ncbi:Cyclic di-GMP phosphodiesterase Gmr [Pigmentiphaga humi]|uniref:Cyclic di-GMP phosphodiesterase Gmr n=1 Tax=Pigmentiphaga humi TaxID=2478468 RepID=A0A3P4B235_9BURK|nr:diguanylate cyclase [Pigmentiphaga humi]VCU70347.1 Cyclic di-GMP phosphodiesterase Gmr [Pigmentiphaga humi]
MQIAPLAPNEEKRLALLHALDLLDTPPEPAFDLITKMVAGAIGAPIALVSLIDRHRQWFKSRVGLDVAETPREYAFCAHCILRDQILLVPDALQDERFFDNPLVAGPLGIRFYAGIPLRSQEGLALGSLCVLDTAPRQLTANQIDLLRYAAQLIDREIARREATLLVRRTSESSLQAGLDSEMRFRAVFEGAGVGIAVVAPDGRLVEGNQALGRIAGYPPDELQGLVLPDLLDPPDRDAYQRLRQELAAAQRPQYSLETRCITRCGTLVWINLTVAARQDHAGKLLYYIAIVENIDERKRAQAELQALQQTLEQQVEQRTRQLQHAHEQLQILTDNLPAMIASFDLELRFRFVNATYELALGKSTHELLGLTLAQVLGEAKAQEIVPYVAQARHTGKRVAFETSLDLPNGNRHYGAVTLIPDITGGRLVGFHSIVHDITEIHKRERQTELEARRDTLTNLPNRRAVQEFLPKAMAQVDEHGGMLDVLFLDLDGFKAVNDTLGHNHGDQLLKEVARRLVALLPQADLVARLSGDEFVVIVRDDGTHSRIDRLARQVVAGISAPVRLGEHQVQIQTSIGIAFYRSGSDMNPVDLLRNADMAMYEAKRAGKNQYRFSAEQT